MASYNLTGFSISSGARSIRIRIPRFEVPSLSGTFVDNISVTLPFRLDSNYSTGNYSVTLILCSGISSENKNWYKYDSGGYSYYGTDSSDSSNRIYNNYYTHVIPSSNVLATTTGTIYFSATQTNTPTTFTFSNLNIPISNIGSEIGVAVLYSNSGALEYSGGKSCSGTITTSTKYKITYGTFDPSKWSGAPTTPQYKNAGESIRIADFPTWIGTSPTSARTVTCNFNGNGQNPISYYVKRWDDKTWQGVSRWRDEANSIDYYPGNYYSKDADLTLATYGWWGENHTDGFYLPTPARNGYSFDGWYTASSGGTKLGNGGDYYDNTSYSTIYAQWTPLIASLTYFTSSSSSVNTKVYYYDNEFKPIKEIYYYNGTNWIKVGE